MLVRDYASLTKPGITTLITVTAAVGYLSAAGSVIDARLFVATLVATALLSGGAATTNQILERRYDAEMLRTRQRPLPSGRVTVRAASAWAVTLASSGGILAIALLPRLSILLLFLSYISYVLYTLLKRHTSACTLVGGIPGALPALAGWCATGDPLAPTALALVAVMFVWQMPHFLAIGWLCRADYARAGFKVISVRDSTGSISGRISMVYAFLLLPISLIPFLTGSAGSAYFAVAALCGCAFFWQSERFARLPSAGTARSLFFTSLVYLPAVFGSLVFLR